MTSATMRTALQKKRARTGRRSSDNEFLPAALEILETPPSPVRMWLILLICAFFASALLWAYIGRIDIIAVAQGKLQPTGRTKIVQPIEAGNVSSIQAQNGRLVKKGDILIELDPSESAADEAGYAADLASFKAEALRRGAAIMAVRRGTKRFSLRRETPISDSEATGAADIPSIKWTADIPEAVRHREQSVLYTDLLQLRAQAASLAAQTSQKQAEKARLAAMIKAQKDLIATLQERVNMRSELLEKSAGSKSNVLDAMESLQYQKTVLAQQIGQLAEAEASLEVLARDTERTYDTFIADNAQKMADAEKQVGDLSEKLAKARARRTHFILRSPIDGVVQSSSVTTVGQVVSPGEEIMRIVPSDAPLEIECYLPNKDIGFVKVGQEAAIKIESFPFTRYGTVRARVTRVARDAIPEPDAGQSEANPNKPTKSIAATGGQRIQNLVFAVTLKPEQTYINVDGAQVPLGAGMAVTAEISTGSRRILEYLFSPLVQIGSESLHER